MSLRAERIILTRDSDDEQDLNIIVEYHYLDLNRYEVTLKTAIRKDSFHFNDGQFQIKMYADGSSTLFRKERGSVKTISNYL
ncbi:hypothetical protein [Daejeonella sp.]|uniref:hypothetical protein n=1 Tax=Daejeonella sp. TaxID=2805397 RepID=UPI0030BDE37F